MFSYIMLRALVTTVIQQNRNLRWYRCVLRKDNSDWVKMHKNEAEGCKTQKYTKRERGCGGLWDPTTEQRRYKLQ